MKFIAEIGWNFLGDLNLAKKMVEAASKANASFAKFQVWDPKFLREGPWDTDGRREIYKKSFLNLDKLEELKEICSFNKIMFLASVFEKRSLDLLKKVDNTNVKIPSHECNNWELIDDARESFENVFLSIGSVSANDFNQILTRYGNKNNVTLMHCVSSYPLKEEHVNLPKLVRIKNRSEVLGYSSHFMGIEDAIAATALGASLIEKHFTINRELQGRDNKFALLPDEFKKMVFDCTTVNKMLLDKGDGIQNIEEEVALVMRGRWNG